MPGPRYSRGKSRKQSHQHPGRGRGPAVAVSSLHLKTASKGWEGREGGQADSLLRRKGQPDTLTTVVNGKKALPLAITITDFSTHLTIL